MKNQTKLLFILLTAALSLSLGFNLFTLYNKSLDKTTPPIETNSIALEANQVGRNQSTSSTPSTQASSFAELSHLDLPDATVRYEDAVYSLQAMLIYAIEDEYLARQEYELILDTYGSIRIFENIMASEVKHIKMLEPLFVNYSFNVPKDSSLDHVILPTSLKDAYVIGVQAEVNNILMYERFLEEDLPDDVRVAFTSLRDASINHLLAFYRQTQK